MHSFFFPSLLASIGKSDLTDRYGLAVTLLLILPAIEFKKEFIHYKE